MPKYIVLPTGRVLDLEGVQAVTPNGVPRHGIGSSSMAYLIELEVAGCRPVYLDFVSKMTRDIELDEINNHLKDEGFCFSPSGFAIRLSAIRYASKEGRTGIRFTLDKNYVVSKETQYHGFEIQKDRDAAWEDITRRLLLLNT